MKPPAYSLQPARDSPKVSGQVLADVPGHLEHVEAFGRASIPFPQRSPDSTQQDSTTMINYLSGSSPSLYYDSAEELLADPASRGHYKLITSTTQKTFCGASRTRNREDGLQRRVRLDRAPVVEPVLLDVHPDLSSLTLCNYSIMKTLCRC